MSHKKYDIPACCGKRQTIFELSFPLRTDTLSYFLNNNFTSPKSYIGSSTLYIENNNMIIMGTFGANLLKIKCKKKDCINDIVYFEELLNNIKV